MARARDAQQESENGLDWRDRVAACRLLAQQSLESIPEILVDLSALGWFAEDQNSEVRAEAREALFQLQAAGIALPNIDLSRVAQGAACDLQHWRARIRCRACRHLGKLGISATAHTEALDVATGDADEQVSAAARAALEKLRGLGIQAPQRDTEIDSKMRMYQEQSKTLYSVQSWKPISFGSSQVQLYNDVSDECLGSRIAELEDCMKRGRQSVAEVDLSEGRLAWKIIDQGSIDAEDSLFERTSEQRSLTLKELAKVEQELRSAIEERGRRQKHRLERKRGDYSFGCI